MSELEAELKSVPIDPVAAMPIPSIRRRAASALVEVGLYCMVAMIVAIVEFYAADFTGPTLFGTKLFDTPTPGDFAASNWLIALVLYAVWTMSIARRSSTPAAHILAMTLVDRRGRPARPARTTLRTLVRTLALYGAPSLLLGGHEVAWIAVFVSAGGLVWFMPRRRAPWDLIAGTTLVESFGVGVKSDDGPLTIDDLRADPTQQAKDLRARRIVVGAGWGAAAVGLAIVWVVFCGAWEFVRADEFEFPAGGLHDLSTLLVGTLWVAGIAMLIAGPVGLGIAIYISEYATRRTRRIVKPAIETLAAVPTVVIGMFIVFYVSPSLLTVFFGDIAPFSILAAGVGVGLLTIPIVASIAEDALRAVPSELREAAFGLGGPRFVVALKVVCPAALSGISAAFVVGVSRTVGETMVVAIAAGGSGATQFGFDPREPGETITAAMANLATGTDRLVDGFAFQSLYFFGALLFMVTLVLNVISDAIVRRFRQAY